MHTHQIIDGQIIPLTTEEITELKARDAEFVPPAEPSAPTKEQLLAELQVLTAKINALG